MAITVRVKVPGTTANCGPGFDAIGIACNIYNYLELTLDEAKKTIVYVEGEGVGVIPGDDRNIAVKAVRMVLERVGSLYKGITIKMNNNIPLARGLGSSAAAIVGGLVAANEATGNILTNQDILNMATEIEGHPDNVAPAIYGGITVSVVEGGAHCLRFLPKKKLTMVVAVPAFTLSTQKARQVLPSEINLKDATFNVGRAALLIGALCQEEYSLLKYAFEDKIHQPYRQELIPGMKDVFKAAIVNGAHGATISGAGPCLIAYTEQNATEIGSAMVKVFQSNGVQAKYVILDIDEAGATAIA